MRIPAAGTQLEAAHCVKWTALAVFLCLACRNDTLPATATIAPAAPRPAAAETAGIGTRPMITTGGSPAPSRQTAPGSVPVILDRDGFDMPALLPRGNVVLHVENRTATPHELELRGGDSPVRATLPASGMVMIQSTLDRDGYDLVCAVPGHDERQAISTYAAGQPIRR